MDTKTDTITNITLGYRFSKKVKFLPEAIQQIIIYSDEQKNLFKKKYHDIIIVKKRDDEDIYT